MATLSEILRLARNATEAQATWTRELASRVPPLTPSAADGLEITRHFATGGGGGLDAFKNASGGIGGNIQSVIAAQLSDKNLTSSYSGEVTKLTDVFDGIYNVAQEKFRSIPEMIGSVIKKSISELNTVFEQEKDLQEILNGKVALTGELSNQFNKNIMYSLPYAMRLGLTFKDIAEMTSEMVAQSGRFKLISTETIEQMSLMSRVAFNNVEEAAKAVEPFQKVSRGVSDAMKVVEKASLSSLQLGLNAKDTTGKLVENIDKLNSYGFKNGVEGLTKMVQKAQSLRLSMDETFKLAEKVMDPTKALSLAANLQVIGGALGDFNDPIKMMWMATNNVEGLQDALAESAESLATFNKDSGVFEIVGADLRRATAMADELGIKLQDITNLAVQSAQRTSAAADLMGNGIIFENEEDKEFLTNLAQMKDGKMTIELPDNLKQTFGANSIALENLDQNQAKTILEFRNEFKKMSATDIATQQLSAMRNIERNVNFVTATLRIEALKRGEDVGKIIGYDPLKAYAQTREYADAVANKVVDVSSKAGKIMQKYYSDSVDTQKKNGTYVPSPSQSATTSNVNINVTSDVDSDVLARKMRNDPEFASHVLRSYLNHQPVR